MTTSPDLGTDTHEAAEAAGAADGYRLAYIRATSAPSEDGGRDWLKYCIAQGSNLITGYRRGDLRSVTAEVEKIVVGLNSRRIINRGRVHLKPARSSRG